MRASCWTAAADVGGPWSTAGADQKSHAPARDRRPAARSFNRRAECQRCHGRRGQCPILHARSASQIECGRVFAVRPVSATRPGDRHPGGLSRGLRVTQRSVLDLARFPHSESDLATRLHGAELAPARRQVVHRAFVGSGVVAWSPPHSRVERSRCGPLQAAGRGWRSLTRSLGGSGS